MAERMSLDRIGAFWTAQAEEHGQSPSASWSDHPVIDLEIREILKRIQDGDRLLDVGCANGFTTLSLALSRNVRVRAIDYIPEMIEQARRRLAAAPASVAERVSFGVGNALRLDEPDGAFDKVLCVRVLINLGAWEHQATALRECVRVLAPGGSLLLSEATLQGWQRLNLLRREWALADIPMPPFNCYLDRERAIDFLGPQLEPIETVNFASTYYVGTRVLKPLLARALGLSLNVGDPSMEWNRWFAQMPAWGDYGTQELMVFRRR